VLYLYISKECVAWLREMNILLILLMTV